MNPVRARAYTKIRERYATLTRSMSCAAAIAIIAEDESVNVLGYSRSYIKDIVSRVDPVRSHRGKSRPRTNVGISLLTGPRK